jgi:hypothetical protein
MRESASPRAQEAIDEDELQEMLDIEEAEETDSIAGH